MAGALPADIKGLPLSVPRLRAPRDHGQILAIPPFDQVGELLESNRRALSSARLPSAGKSLDELRALARQELTAISARYHKEAGEPAPQTSSHLWLVAGHQPELFHPGVWFKNFALHRLAQQHGAASLNLIVDTDTVKPAILHAPHEGRIARVTYDRSTLETPYEERVVEEEATFAELPQRMKPITEHWGFEPMLDAFWRDVLAQTKRTPLLGERFAAARRGVERRWGVVQCEAPMSRVCQTEAFAVFACSILNDLPRFQASYNQTVQEYRRTHRIRSHRHPVPDLAEDGDWLEAPFWAWRRGQGRRSRLFVRPSGANWELRVAGEVWPSMPACCLGSWQALEARGFKIRSRALTTTMFARLFLADLFLHGIGGGIYDELTDRILERHFAITPPAYLTVSATLLLPFARFPGAVDRQRDLTRHRRDFIYKPERFIERNAMTEPLIQAKEDWIRRSGATHADRAERFERIRALNDRLADHVRPDREHLEREIEEVDRQVAWHETVSRRDFAFCLYPENMLRSYFVNTDFG
jgi:hypothetical protein